jgi:alcohol dehydrogenase class IV
MLPTALRVNRAACETQYAELEKAVEPRRHANASAAADAFVDRIERLCELLGVPRSLSALGVRREQIDDLVRGSHGNSMDGNPRDVSDSELRDLLESLL